VRAEKRTPLLGRGTPPPLRDRAAAAGEMVRAAGANGVGAAALEAAA